MAFGNNPRMESKSANAELEQQQFESYMADLDAEDKPEVKAPNNTKVKLTLPVAETKTENCPIDDLFPHELQDLCLENLYHKENTTYVYPRVTFFQKNLIQHNQLMPILSQAAEHILWGRADEAIALAKDYPAILDYVIEAKDPLGRRVKGTLLQIAAAAGDVNIEKYDLCLMSNEIKQPENWKLYLREKDGCIAYTVKTPTGEVIRDKVINTLKAPHPFDLDNLNLIKKSILEVTSKAGHTQALEEKEQGIVERLSSLMSKEEVESQLAEWFPLGWEDVNNQRMQRYLNALNEFAESIFEAKIANPEYCSLQQLRDAQAKCKPIIDKLRKALQPDPNEIVTSGYILDTQVFYQACKLFEDKFKQRLGGWASLKSDIFWVNGFGSLQAIASARDAHVIRKGIGNVADSKAFPERSLKNSDGVTSDFFTPSSRLGLDFLLGYYGGAGLPSAFCHWYMRGMLCIGLWKSYVEQKRAGRIMPQPENQSKKSMCVIL